MLKHSMSSARRGLFLLTFCTIYLLLAPIAYDAASRWLLTTERNTKSDCWPDIYSTSLFSNHRHFLNGWFWAAVLFPLAERFEKILWRSFFADGDDELYGLHHAILNVEVPPKSMWMNMGYWEVCGMLSICMKYRSIADVGSMRKHSPRRAHLFCKRCSRQLVCWMRMANHEYSRAPRASNSLTSVLVVVTRLSI